MHGIAGARVGNSAKHPRHIFARAACHGAPARTTGDLQQAVVMAEAREGADREAQHLRDRARPDRAYHRKQVSVAKGGGESLALQKAAYRLRGQRAVAMRERHCGRGAVETRDVGEHAQERGPQQVAALGEDRVQAGARPFERVIRERDGERHVGFGGRNAQFLEKRDEMRVRAVVEHEKTGVDGVRHAVERDVHRVRMAAEVSVGFKERRVDRGVVLRKPPRARKPGNSRPDDSNSHEISMARALGEGSGAFRAASLPELRSMSRPGCTSTSDQHLSMINLQIRL